ncbi:hypothetical protein EDD21DRAFT_444822 [Dissophora ornata]|nr:hypothetical protein BGZ58_005091 [Dissophora ornata]KAI8600077.1 hypothetical protein EDD21DRAFT_444822 [Dissophora ornata]
MSSKELSAFLTWAEENEILWDKSAIEIKEGKHGLGVYAKQRLDAGYEVVRVPKAIVLSVETTGIANLLADDEVEGYIGLTMGCMYEMSRGAQSPWSAYLALLAKRPPLMATSLSKEAREMLKYCEAYNDIESDIKDMQEDYDSIVVPFIEKHSDVFTKEIKAEFFSFDAFKTMTGHVSSRSMDVDNFHVSALVPFADFVNHSQTPNADFLTVEDVCEICGALVCEHREEEDEDEDMDSESDEAPDLAGDDNADDDEVPALAGEDISSSKKSKSSKKDAEKMEEEDGEEWEDEEEDEDDEDQEINDTCDITLDEDVKKGEEITRHYGPYPNKIIFSKYGFAMEDNAHDTVTIQLEMVRQTAEKFIKDEKLVEERIQWFLESEDAFIGAEDEDDHEHSGGCCGGEDPDCSMEECDSGAEKGHCDDKVAKKQTKANADGVEETGVDSDEEGEDEEEEEEEEEDDFPRDIMYMMHDGSIDDRLLMLLNVLFMEKDQFAKVQEDMDIAMEYFNDIFTRRQQEEHGDEDEDEDMEDDDEEEGEKMPKPELKPRDAKSKKVRKAVLEAILALVHIRADAFGVTNKTTAEQDLATLKKAKLSDILYYGGLCVQGEKQILQNALKGYTDFLSVL